MSNFKPVILCGGSGKRLWPLSRESYPKQFSHIISPTESLLQSTIRRLNAAGGKDPLLVSNNDYRFIVGEQASSMDSGKCQILIEPVGRNTAPAICAAALHVAETNPEAVIFVSPSDHFIGDEAVFNKAAAVAIKRAKEGIIVTFGIVPDRAETGYGYIELAEKYSQSVEPIPFVKFTEKPALPEAEKMFKSGRFLWNSGMFVMTAETAIDAFKMHAPQVYATVLTALKQGSNDLDFFRLSEVFEDVPDISFDHAVMEYVKGEVIPLDCGWNDLGSWETVHLESEKDDKGNASQGSVTTIDCENSLLRSESPKTHMVGLGLKNIAAIAMADAVLVADLSNSQAVSEAVTLMRQNKICQADGFPRSSRPWGWFETLTKRSRFRVKSIVVKPGHKLSLQSHVHRAEHWVVVEGTAKVTIDDEEKMVTENESVFIPLGAVHRLENVGRVELHLIEVQTGSYLEEDDIVRYDDDYQRG